MKKASDWYYEDKLWYVAATAWALADYKHLLTLAISPALLREAARTRAGARVAEGRAPATASSMALIFTAILACSGN
jgi:hypothetical protein